MNAEYMSRRIIAMAQLLVIFGADINAPVGGIEQENEALSNGLGLGLLGRWFLSVANWSPLQIAVSCRLHEEARRGLRMGWIYVGPGLVPADLLETAKTAGAWLKEASKLNQATADATVRLVVDCTREWGPTHHHLYHPGFRAAVWTIHHVALRFMNGIVPAEIWRIIATYLSRHDFELPARVIHPGPMANGENN